MYAGHIISFLGYRMFYRTFVHLLDTHDTLWIRNETNGTYQESRPTGPSFYFPVNKLVYLTYVSLCG